MQVATLPSPESNFGPVLALKSAPTAHGLNLVIRAVDEPARPSALDDLGFDAARAELERVVTDVRRGLVLLVSPNPALRQTALCAVAADPMMRVRSVCTVDVSTDVALPRVSHLESSGEGGAAAAIRFAIDLDHDVVLVDVADHDAFRAVVDVALDDAMVVAAVESFDAVGALERLCVAVPPFLLASSLVLVIVTDHARGTTVLPVPDELRDAILDGTVTSSLARSEDERAAD